MSPLLLQEWSGISHTVRCLAAFCQCNLCKITVAKFNYLHTHMSRLMKKPIKWSVPPAKTQISLGIRPVWSVSPLCTQWIAKDPSFLHADSEDSDQTVDLFSFGAHSILSILSWDSSYGLLRQVFLHECTILNLQRCQFLFVTASEIFRKSPNDPDVRAPALWPQH